jgi:hypothetical protein
MNFDKPERNICRSTWLPPEMCDYMYSRQYTNSDWYDLTRAHALHTS